MVLGAVAVLAAGCNALPQPTQLAGSDEFPPPVIAGVTKFAQVAPPDVTPPDSSVPPPVIAGVTRFAATAPDLGVPDSSVDKPVMWARFGVTREAADRETAIAGGKAQGKGG
jgi:hypothetical protein